MRGIYIALTWLGLITASFPANAKDVLVLLPLSVDSSLKAEAQLFGTALQQGLSSGFEVFYGPAVEDKLKVEYAKEGCTAESCAQNLAIAFNGELIGDAAIQKLDNSFVVQLQINNIVTGQIEKSLIEICENCSKLSLLQFVKKVGAKAGGQSSPPEIGQIATPMQSAEPAGQSLRIETGSTNTSVIINGENIGRAPLTTPNSYQANERLEIELITPGYKDLRFAHIVGRNDQQLRNITLVKETKKLRIRSSPSRSDVVINGKSVGRTPLETEEFPIDEEIEIRIEKTGYSPLELSHIVGRNDEQLTKLELGLQKRRLYIDSQPRSAKIYIDKEFFGETPNKIGPFEDGKRVRIRVEKDGYKAFSSRHRVGRNDDTLSLIELEKIPTEDAKSNIRPPMGF